MKLPRSQAMHSVAAGSAGEASPSSSVEPRPLHVLLVEDSEADTVLLLRTLREGGYDPRWERVDTPGAMRAALARGGWEVVVSDHNMPAFNAPAALALLQESGLDLPFLIVSGFIGEEAAVAAMKAGAHDYVIKGHLARLVPAIERELYEADVRRQRKRAERNSNLLLDVAKHISGNLDVGDLLHRVAQRTMAVLPCDGVVTFNWDAAQGAFRATSHEGIPPDLVPVVAGLQFAADQPFDGRVALGETIALNDLARQAWLPPELCARFDLSAVVVAPLRVGSRHLGALVAFRTGADQAFDAAHVELIEGIALQLSVALEAAELYEARQEEAEVSGALARVAQELIASIDSPYLLDRLCHLTAEVLQCDGSHTLLSIPKREVFAVVAGFGDTPEIAEARRVIEIPSRLLAGILDAFETQPVAQIVFGEKQDLFRADLDLRYGVSAVLYAPLRRGSEIVGIHTASYRRVGRFSSRQQRIAAGFAQLASMALDNARLIAELERANRLKSEFVATMSHELRTPLNIILGYGELLLDQTFGAVTEDQAEVLGRMQLSARQLLTLIDATLDMSRLEGGDMPLRLERIDPATVLRELDVETEDHPGRQNPSLSVEFRATNDLPAVRTDALKLKVALRNLLENAVKFTESGSVVVEVRAVDDGIEFSVCDTGIGIAPEALAIIFEPFRQADGSDRRRYSGAGLGLYIARRMMDLLGGTVRVESEAGRGSEFRLWLPLETDSALGESDTQPSDRG